MDLDKLPARITEEHEELIRNYKLNPTKKVRDYIVRLCDRFIKMYYKKNFVPVEWEEYYSEAVCRTLELLDQYEPHQGSFTNWVQIGLDGFAKSIRFKANRYEKRNKLYGLRPVDNQAGRSEGFFTEEPVFKKHEKESIHNILGELKVRFRNPTLRRFIRGVVRYLKQNGSFPSVKLLNDYWGPKGLTEDRVEFLYNYSKVIVQIHMKCRWQD